MTTALDALKNVVERYGPDTLYVDRDPESLADGCRYVREDGTPSCLVGVVLAEEYGFDLSLIQENAETVTTLHNKGLFDDLDLSADDIAVLSVAQGVQDADDTWGEALQSATRFVEQGGL